jgi:hypothetical protein
VTALTRALTRRCRTCGRIGRQYRETGDAVTCLPCYADEHACDVCGGKQDKRRVVGPVERERLPDLAGHVEVICVNCLKGARR